MLIVLDSLKYNLRNHYKTKKGNISNLYQGKTQVICLKKLSTVLFITVLINVSN